jgi:tRNA(Met) C34 N-acetyltransferase TmcA
LGIGYPAEALSGDARRLIGAMAHQMEMALATVQMQQRLFETLREMGPEMQSLQQLNTRLEQATPSSLETLKAEVALLPEFPQIVKDALVHYWGGPKLSDSPLLGLRMVRRLMTEQGGSPTKALQAVLRQAIENLRPDQQLDPSAQEWVLYNILEMRFLQGRKIRDTAERLAMSESDLYRKQRVAVEEVARQLALMEETEKQ